MCRLMHRNLRFALYTHVLKIILLLRKDQHLQFLSLVKCIILIIMTGNLPKLNEADLTKPESSSCFFSRTLTNRVKISLGKVVWERFS